MQALLAVAPVADVTFARGSRQPCIFPAASFHCSALYPGLMQDGGPLWPKRVDFPSQRSLPAERSVALLPILGTHDLSLGSIGERRVRSMFAS